MDDRFKICYQKQNGDWVYVMGWGIQSMKNHIDYIMGQGFRLVSVKNVSL